MRTRAEKPLITGSIFITKFLKNSHLLLDTLKEIETQKSMLPDKGIWRQSRHPFEITIRKQPVLIIEFTLLPLMLALTDNALDSDQLNCPVTIAMFTDFTSSLAFWATSVATIQLYSLLSRVTQALPLGTF